MPCKEAPIMRIRGLLESVYTPASEYLERWSHERSALSQEPDSPMLWPLHAEHGPV